MQGGAGGCRGMQGGGAGGGHLPTLGFGLPFPPPPPPLGYAENSILLLNQLYNVKGDAALNWKRGYREQYNDF